LITSIAWLSLHEQTRYMLIPLSYICFPDSLNPGNFIIGSISKFMSSSSFRLNILYDIDERVSISWPTDIDSLWIDDCFADGCSLRPDLEVYHSENIAKAISFKSKKCMKECPICHRLYSKMANLEIHITSCLTAYQYTYITPFITFNLSTLRLRFTRFLFLHKNEILN